MVLIFLMKSTFRGNEKSNGKIFWQLSKIVELFVVAQSISYDGGTESEDNGSDLYKWRRTLTRLELFYVFAAIISLVFPYLLFRCSLERTNFYLAIVNFACIKFTRLFLLWRNSKRCAPLDYNKQRYAVGFLVAAGLHCSKCGRGSQWNFVL